MVEALYTLDIAEIAEKFAAFDQGHVLQFWHELDETSRRRLLAELQSVDLSQLRSLREGKGLALPPSEEWLAEAVLPDVIPLGRGTENCSPAQAREIGLASLAAGEVAVILVAGGKGTRLGFPYPKGIFPIGPVSGVSLFQIHVEKIRARSARVGVHIPLCIMTSPATDLQTRAFFAAHDNFGLAAEQLYFFRQGTMPAVDAETGKILLAAKDRLALSPDGHGGMLAALRSSGLIEKLRSRGIKRIFYFQVDNPLVDICCPEFLGYHIALGASMSTQVIAKKTPQDRLGNVVRIGDRLHVIEYSDLPEGLAERQAPDGGLLFRWGSIAVHIFELSFLAVALELADCLPWHVARKRVGFVDSTGAFIQPKQPNAIQYERFIFDLMPQADRAILVAVPEEAHFAPLKNASGDPSGDTPEAVQAALCRLWRQWLAAAGAFVERDAVVEISPLFALDGEELGRKIPRGTKFEESAYLRPI